jgi:hypothetical protein
LFLISVRNFLDYSSRQFLSLKFSHTKTLQPTTHAHFELQELKSVPDLGGVQGVQLYRARAVEGPGFNKPMLHELNSKTPHLIVSGNVCLRKKTINWSIGGGHL